MEAPKVDQLVDSFIVQVTRLALIEGWKLERIRQHLDQTRLQLAQRHSGFDYRLTLDQLKRRLKIRGIKKNLSEKEVFYIKDNIGSETTRWRWLVFANGVLLDNLDVEKHYQKKKGHRRASTSANRGRDIAFMQLPFDFQTLSDSNKFKHFRRLCFYAKVHFEHSFDSSRWAPDHRGLYARNTELRADLSALSTMHNLIFDALTQYKSGRHGRCQTLIDNTLLYHKSIVLNYHHRQFPDILAIILLLDRTGFKKIQEKTIKNLVFLARQNLLVKDPRRIMFECLLYLPFDPTGHLYLAFDAYCRHLWRSRTKSDDFKAFYSYNQSSFPRADMGEFYALFKGKEFFQIDRILGRVDNELGLYSHETFMLWHTAMRCLQAEHRYEEMEKFAQCLCSRVRRLGPEYDYHEDRQLNYDSMLSFYLLGDALDAQGSLYGAKAAFEISVWLRSQILRGGVWDAGKAASLRRLEAIATRLGDTPVVSNCSSMEEQLYAGTMP